MRWTIAVLPLSALALVDFFCAWLHAHLLLVHRVFVCARRGGLGGVQTHFATFPAVSPCAPKRPRGLFPKHRSLDLHDTLDWVSVARVTFAVQRERTNLALLTKEHQRVEAPTMLEVLATLIILALMLVPGSNMLVGALAWGLAGFLIGAAISLAIPTMFWIGLHLGSVTVAGRWHA